MARLLRKAEPTTPPVDVARNWVTPDLKPEDVSALFRPINVGPVKLANRFAMSAMGTRFATSDGQITDRHLAYYSRRSRGGAAAIFVEGSSVDPTGTTYLRKPRLYDDRFLPGLEQLASAIRHGGAIPGIQLMHSGRHASPLAREGPALSVSGGGSLVHPTGSRPITESEIARVIASFGSAAARARRAGFELIEIHAAHGYLIHDFLSPLFNRRTDGWGGDLRFRARFLMEVIRCVKASMDGGAGILVRLSSSEFVDGGIQPADAAATAVLAEEAGADAVLVSGGNNESIEWVVPPVFMPFGPYLEHAASVRQLVRIPVGVVGRLSTPQLAARAITSGSADLVFMGRALLADPDFVQKTRKAINRPIRPCIACNECLAQHIRDQPILCTVNPAAGREREEDAIHAAATPRRIAVVGAGPAGLLFASIAARRGHSVTVVERGYRSGGKLWLAAAAPYKTTEMLALYTSLQQEVEDSGAEILLGQDVEHAEVLRDLSPDLVVVATGAVPSPDTDVEREPGVEIVQAEDYLAMESPPNWPSVVIIGAGDTACDAAARLATAGTKVWMLARGSRMARGVEPVSSRVLRRYLHELDVKVLFNVQVTRVGLGKVHYLDAENMPHSLAADQVVYSRGVQATGPVFMPDAVGPWEAIAIGDAYDPGNFLSSMRSAWELARQV